MIIRPECFPSHEDQTLKSFRPKKKSPDHDAAQGGGLTEQSQPPDTSDQRRITENSRTPPEPFDQRESSKPKEHMNRKNPVALLAGWIALLLTPLHTALAQSTENGSIEGRVLNVGTGNYLNNAQVEIVGLGLKTLTNS